MRFVVGGSLLGQSSEVVRRLARRHPYLAKAVLWAFSKVYMLFPKKQHWLLDQIARDIDYRVPAFAKLGNGMSIQVAWNDVVGREIYEYGWYEPDTVRVIASALKAGDVFLDIGAHVGQYTLLASEIVGDSGSVHSFEPDPATFQWLSKNVYRNRLMNVTLNHCAVAGSSGSSIFYLSTTENIGANSLSPGANFSGKTVEVGCTTVDAYVAEKRIGRISLMKIDVEGAELQVLEGAQSLLGRADRPRIVLEFSEAAQKRFDSCNAKLVSLLCDLGYRLYKISENGVAEYKFHSGEDSFFNVYAVPAGEILR